MATSRRSRSCATSLPRVRNQALHGNQRLAIRRHYSPRARYCARLTVSHAGVARHSAAHYRLPWRAPCSNSSSASESAVLAAAAMASKSAQSRSAILMEIVSSTGRLSRQGLVEVGDDVFHRFDADGEAEKIVVDAQPRAMFRREFAVRRRSPDRASSSAHRPAKWRAPSFRSAFIKRKTPSRSAPFTSKLTMAP